MSKLSLIPDEYSLGCPFELETGTPDYSKFIHVSKYARWLEDEKRRETWYETVLRYVTFFQDQITSPELAQEIFCTIYSLQVMPSMRALMTAGEAAERSNIALYNCAYIAVDAKEAFSEIMYVLMNGTGIGFSVERQYINRLPTIKKFGVDTSKARTHIVVKDSKEGWSEAYAELIKSLYEGHYISWDVSGVRPAGERLKVFGGRASGAEPLVELFKFTINIFHGAAERRLNSIECHDIVCKVASVIVVGGVRRSALISLSNLSDNRMRQAKSGEWWIENPQRALANNSVNYTEKPEIGSFMNEFKSLYDSKSGERGIMSSYVNLNTAPERRKILTEKYYQNESVGVNPCSEIVLRDSGQFCNLSEVIVRDYDTVESLANKVRVAAIIGTIQSSRTDFKFLRHQWKDNCDLERLLGVSMTGVCDHLLLSHTSMEASHVLKMLKAIAVEENRKYAMLLGINQSAAVTCNKPSGTVSQLVDCASGIHPRYSKYYIRTIRADNKDALTKMMIAQGIPNEPCAMNPERTTIFSFPIKAPNTAVFRDDKTAIQQLDYWKMWQESWCEHKPSVTIYVKENEWIGVMNWCWDNFDILSGVSFLPHSDHSYQQAPYQEIDRVEYVTKMRAWKDVDYSTLSKYELEDETTAMSELACTAGACEIP